MGSRLTKAIPGESAMRTAALNRRTFLQDLACRRPGPRRRLPGMFAAAETVAAPPTARVALTAGDDRADNTFRRPEGHSRRNRPRNRRSPRGDQTQQRRHRPSAFGHEPGVHGGHPGIPEVDRQARPRDDRRSAANGPTLDGFATTATRGWRRSTERNWPTSIRRVTRRPRVGREGLPSAPRAVRRRLLAPERS